MKITLVTPLLAFGMFLSAPALLSADVTYYYNSLDSNPFQFTGYLTLPSNEPGQILPILTFFMTAVVDGQTLTYTTANQSGGAAEAEYDTNPADPLDLLYPYPTYGVIVNPVLGGQTLVLGPATPAAYGFGAPMIYDVPSYPVTVSASDNGVWLLTPPSPTSASAPEPSGVGLFVLLALATVGLCTAHRRRSNSRPSSAA
jgi:hypothetical protein